jgi:pimeloyl-ACP methyl ester carboxylesterase
MISDRWLLALAAALVACGGPQQATTGSERMKVRSGSAELHGRVAGEGPVVVLLHAGVADLRGWDAVIEDLSRDHRVVAYDRRGFGATTYEPEAYADVDDLAAILDAVGAETAVLVGNSQGGRVAIDFALAYPGRVRSLILVAPAVSGDDGDWDDLPAHTAALVREYQAAEAAGDLDAVNLAEAHLWLDGPSSARGRVSGSARDLFLDMNGTALRAAPPGDHRDASPPAADRLGELTMPVHVLVGDLDLELIGERARRIADTIPSATLTVMAGVAHLPQLEQPSAFLTALRAVLR